MIFFCISFSSISSPPMQLHWSHCPECFRPNPKISILAEDIQGARPTDHQYPLHNAQSPAFCRKALNLSCLPKGTTPKLTTHNRISRFRERILIVSPVIPSNMVIRTTQRETMINGSTPQTNLIIFAIVMSPVPCNQNAAYFSCCKSTRGQ